MSRKIRANHRLAESLATVAEPHTLGDLLQPLGQPVRVAGRRRARALNPLTGKDGTWLRVLGRGAWLLNGFRNGDVRAARQVHAGPGVIRRPATSDALPAGAESEDAHVLRASGKTSRA